MFLFECKVDKQIIKVSSMVGCLNVRYKEKNYLIVHDEKEGWIQKVGNLPEKDFKKICEAIEKKILEG